jgi:hypothetical protein
VSVGTWGRRVPLVRKPLNSSGFAFASEWNVERNLPETASTVGLGDKRKFWWTGSCGHTWKASIPSRVGGSGCAVCAGKQVSIGVNDLVTTHPNIAKEWDYELNASLTPEIVSKGSGKKVFWRCPSGHSYACTVANRTLGTGCPYCSGRKFVPGENDLFTLYKEIAREWSSKNELSPDQVGAHSGKSVFWICSYGHEWKTTVHSRTSAGTGCPTCWGRIRKPGENDAATVFPFLKLRYDNELNSKKLSEFGPKSSAKVWWKCEQGHSYQSSIVNQGLGAGCNVCLNKRLQVGVNDLQTVSPNLALQFDVDKNKATPDQIIATTAKSYWWLCELGHSYKVSLHGKINKETGCPFCTGVKVLTGFNDLKTKFPQIARQWHPQKNGRLRPEEIGSSHKKVWWIDDLGHEWQATIASRAHQGVGCPFCSNNQLLVGFNDLETQNPELAREWDYERNFPLLPNQVVSGGGKKYWWTCTQGHTWRTDITHRLFGRGCPSCAKTGFDPNLPGYLYLVWHQDWEMFQIGITNFPDKRLARHKRNGFEVLEVRGPMEGHLTSSWETSLLRYLKYLGADLGNKQVAGKFDGFSESWTKRTYSVNSLLDLMNACEAHEMAIQKS